MRMSEPRTININARISPALHAALRDIADTDRRKVATLIALLLEEAVAHRLGAAEPQSKR